MTPEERELISGVAESLRATDRSGKDPDAERLIRESIAGQPDAAYLLTQRVIVAELALKRAEARLAEVEGGSGGRGFLPGSAGGHLPVARRVDQGYAAGPPAAAPGSGVGSFLKTAAAAAAGTIAAELIYDGLRHVVAGGGPGAGWAPPAPTPHWGGPTPRPEPDDRPVAPGPADPFDLSGSESAGGPDAAGGDWGDAAPGGDFAGGDFGEPADEPDPGDEQPADDGGDFGGGDFGDAGDAADPGDAGGGDW